MIELWNIKIYRKVRIRKLSLLVLNNGKLEVEILEVYKKLAFVVDVDLLNRL